VFGASESGIYLLNSNNGTLFNNTCSENKNGIYIVSSDNHTINENDVRLCSNGIKIETSNNITLSNNTAYNCGNGIFLLGTVANPCKNVTIIQNNMTKCGLCIEGDQAQLKTHKIESNFANNKPIHYYFNFSNLQPLDFQNSGQILLYYCNDSVILNVNASYTSRGLVLYYCNNIKISYCNFSFNKYYGIFQYYGTNNTMVNNYDISNNGYIGIQIVFSNNNSIVNTTRIDNNVEIGIQTALSDNITISGNNLYNNTEYGIYISTNLGGNRIKNNSIGNSQIGLDISYCSNNVVRENIFFNCGLLVGGDTLDDLFNDVDLSNKVNGKILYYYDGVIDLRENDFSNAGQIILINCNHSITSNVNTSSATQGISIYFSYNISISHCISSSNFNDGIYIYKSTNISLSSTEAKFCRRGVYIYTLINGTISNSNITNNREDGLYLLWGNDVRIVESKFLNNSKNGLEFWSLTNSIIHNNTIRYNGENGIGSESGSQNNRISFNNISSNEENGLKIGLAHTNISNNCIFNNKIGINIDGGSYHNFTRNIIKNNINYGITINKSYSTLNTIINNTFLNNGISNAYDKGTNNHWDNGVFGNSWDDYTAGIDANDDGISESGVPYSIPGGSSQDNYPLYWDAPVISWNAPTNNTLYGREAPNVFAFVIEGHYHWFWYTFNLDPTKYNFSQPSDTLNQTAWKNLNNGTHILHFFANDSRGYMTSIDLILRKDSLHPIINIVEPTPDQPCGSSAPNFEIEITEPHLHSIWYRLYNNSIYTDNYSCTDTGTINQTAWDSMWKYTPEGDKITIIFYANDTVRNCASYNVSVIKATTSITISGDNGGGGGKSKEIENFNLVDFLTSPAGLAIIGGTAAALGAVIIIITKKRSYRAREKEKERIEKIRGNNTKEY
jgi:parallel beta-helix repeat protein